ncbi:helix-turn-helix transcriptional regulator [Parashewanella tropica]|uniref:helix-turn-helix transcriptional regulator n=1 Tax=Parashewanella tropica TaxID=2547970 RepID=UPI00105A9F8E|nr:helix-turn-helix transcriptional regulator [Parashewanella tropica]
MPTTDSKLQFSQRLNQLLDRHNFPPKNMGRITLLSELFEITHKGAGNWLNGKAIPSRKMLKSIGEHFGVSVDWLIFGHKHNESVSSGSIEIPVIRKSQINNFLEGKFTDFEQYLPVQESLSSKAFVIDSKEGDFELDFLISNSAKLVFDPEHSPFDKCFALININEELLIKLLMEYDKGNFAVKLQNEQMQDEIQMLKDNQIVATLTEIRFL